MKDNLVYTRSSYLVSLPVLLGCLVLCVLTAFFGQRTVSLLLMFLAVLAGASRLWARSAAGSLWVRVRGGNQGVFPGEHFSVELEVRNRRFFPIVWLELSFPLAKNLCLVPEDRREPDEAEQVWRRLTFPPNYWVNCAFPCCCGMSSGGSPPAGRLSAGAYTLWRGGASAQGTASV